jgi:hypothetical protein
MKRLVGMMVMFLGLSLNAHAVPPVLNYAGQVTVNGEAFDGAGLFKFALVNTDGTTTYWSNDGTSVGGSEPQASVSVAVNGGLYSILLGNTAQQGMGAIDPALFAQHSDAKLRVWFSDGVNGFQQLNPDRPFASVPYAFSAGTAQTAGSATIAPGSIDRSMLSEDIRSDLNRTISHNDLSPQIKADINATIGLDRLSSDVISKLEQNATITNGSVTGSKMADGSVTASKIASNAITTNELSEQILKYLKPEISSQPLASKSLADTNASFSVIAEGKYLAYQWKKDGVDLAGETNATLKITDANATLHDGNYSVVVSNDFGSVESGDVELKIHNLNDGIIAWWDFDNNGSDKSSNGNDASPQGNFEFVNGKVNKAIRVFNGGHIMLPYLSVLENSDSTFSFWVKEESMSSSHGEAYLKIGNIIEIGNYYNVATFSFLSETSFESAIQRNEWNHYVISRFQNSQTGFLNGSNVGTGGYNYREDFTFTNSAIAKHWWNNGGSSSTRLTGAFDDFRIYNRALSEIEVRALYNKGY